MHRIILLVLLVCFSSGQVWALERAYNDPNVIVLDPRLPLSNVTVKYEPKKGQSKVTGTISNFTGTHLNMYSEIMFFDGANTLLGSVKFTTVDFPNGTSKQFSGKVKNSDLSGWAMCGARIISLSQSNDDNKYTTYNNTYDNTYQEYGNRYITPGSINSDPRFPVQELSIQYDPSSRRSTISGSIYNESGEEHGSPKFRLTFYDRQHRTLGFTDFEVLHLSAGETRTFSAKAGDLQKCAAYSLSHISSFFQRQPFNMRHNMHNSIMPPDPFKQRSSRDQRETADFSTRIPNPFN